MSTKSSLAFFSVKNLSNGQINDKNNFIHSTRQTFVNNLPILIDKIYRLQYDELRICDLLSNSMPFFLLLGIFLSLYANWLQSNISFIYLSVNLKKTEILTLEKKQRINRHTILSKM